MAEAELFLCKMLEETDSNNAGQDSNASFTRLGAFKPRMTGRTPMEPELYGTQRKKLARKESDDPEYDMENIPAIFATPGTWVAIKVLTSYYARSLSQ